MKIKAEDKHEKREIRLVTKWFNEKLNAKKYRFYKYPAKHKSSYGWKHTAEDEIGEYISNNAFKKAMMILGQAFYVEMNYKRMNIRSMETLLNDNGVNFYYFFKEIPLTKKERIQQELKKLGCQE